jgi:hypothetical protein
LLDINFISQAEIPKERFNPNTGMMDIVRNSTQQVYFINYPGALDTIRLAFSRFNGRLHCSAALNPAQVLRAPDGAARAEVREICPG